LDRNFVSHRRRLIEQRAVVSEVPALLEMELYWKLTVSAAHVETFRCFASALLSLFAFDLDRALDVFSGHLSKLSFRFRVHDPACVPRQFVGLISQID
jgi:hypothetical protein